MLKMMKKEAKIDYYLPLLAQKSALMPAKNAVHAPAVQTEQITETLYVIRATYIRPKAKLVGRIYFARTTPTNIACFKICPSITLIKSSLSAFSLSIRLVSSANN